MRALPFLVAACLLLAATSGQEEDLPMYKECLMECLRCVKTYGKNIYNGKLCAENCALSRGQSIDAKCYPPAKRTGSKGKMTADCVHKCQNSCYDDDRDAYACIFLCILSEEKVVSC